MAIYEDRRFDALNDVLSELRWSPLTNPDILRHSTWAVDPRYDGLRTFFNRSVDPKHGGRRQLQNSLIDLCNRMDDKKYWLVNTNRHNNITIHAADGLDPAKLADGSLEQFWRELKPLAESSIHHFKKAGLPADHLITAYHNALKVFEDANAAAPAGPKPA